MSHLPIPDAVTRWVHTARREDLETLAAAQLNTTAQMRCAYDWDGAADWLETIARTATEANQRLLSPNGLPAPTLDGDEGMFAWRIWLGPSVDTWQQDYDPTTPSQWQPTYACEAPEPWTEPMVRQMADHLTEQQTGVFLSILGRGVDDWHDACLTSDDILEALDALDAALTGTPHPETLRAQKEAEQRARDLRWNRERVALAAAVQAVQAVCPAAHDVRYRLIQGSWKVVGLYNGDGEPLTGHGSPWDVLLSMLPQLSGDLPSTTSPLRTSPTRTPSAGFPSTGSPRPPRSTPCRDPRGPARQTRAGPPLISSRFCPTAHQEDPCPSKPPPAPASTNSSSA